MARKVLDEPSEDVVTLARQQRQARRSPFAKIALFIRQVFGELRKVVTPTRRELFGFITVVLVFVIVMMAVVGVLDFVFSAVVVFVFGDPSVAS